MAPTPEQRAALHYSEEGHNILITGQCGTGKTFALKQIVLALKKEKSVAITSTTGVASYQLGFGATTLHHWSGIRDGRLTVDEINRYFLLDEQFSEARHRIRSAQTLVIDEIGMLSELILEKVELVCRLARNSKLVFGGLQVIASGDFKQLPPVPNYLYGDSGQYCFISSVFQKTFPHHFNFKQVVRQNQLQLIQAINELCDGNPTQETEAFLKSLDRPVLNGQNQNITFLLGTNFDVEYINQEKIDEMIPGQSKYFRSIDTGRSELLHSCAACKVLTLKVGAPVILIRNISEGLYNGCIGQVSSISEDNIVVNFDQRLVNMERCLFEIYDPTSKKVLASRQQFPLRLAYAMTVHRAQGQSIQYLEVDCYSFFAPGQMGVAIGRATCTDGLRIVNYNSTAARLKHDQIVYNFYGLDSMQPLNNLECCRNTFTVENDTDIVVHDSDEIIDDNSMAQIIDMTEGFEEVTDDELPSTSHATPTTHCLYTIETFIDDSNEDDLKLFEPQLKVLLEKHFEKVQELFTKYPKKAADFTLLFKSVNTYLISDDHFTLFTETLRNTTCNKNNISTKLFLWVVNQEISRQAKIITDKQVQSFDDKHIHENNEKVPVSAGLSKLRYLAGACIFNSRKRLRTTVLNKLSKSCKKSKMDRKLAYRKQQLLSNLRISEEEITSTTEIPDSLLELKFRQGDGKHLFQVSDQVFSFFTSLNQKVQIFLTDESFHIYGKDVHTKCRSFIKYDDCLVQKWCNLFEDHVTVKDGDPIDENIDEIFTALLLDMYEMIVEYFIKIALSNAIKRFKASIPRTKKQALRAKVQALGNRQTSTCNKRKAEEPESSTSVFKCPVCNNCLEENPETFEEQSIACDFCNNWYHCKCVYLTGNEPCFKKKSLKWKCANCKRGGKFNKK